MPLKNHDFNFSRNLALKCILILLNISIILYANGLFAKLVVKHVYIYSSKVLSISLKGRKKFNQKVGSFDEIAIYPTYNANVHYNSKKFNINVKTRLMNVKNFISEIISQKNEC